ncbi:MAG: DUF4430 domain-containing protein [Eubacterium sp.]|nr:MAG: hypothetical protein DBY03_00190 [Clostridiales bacterium]
MRQRKKVWSICLVIALVFSSIFTWNEPALTAYASETKTEKIVVYVAAQGKSLDGTKTVAIDKTPVQVDKGTNAAAAVKAVLDASDYKDNYDIPDTGYGPYLESINGMGTEQAGKNWYYWSFYVNGQYSNVGMGSYVLQEGDQISLIYTYDDLSTEASVFADDTSLNPETPAVESAEASMKKAQGIAAKEIYNSYFADGHIPGLGSVNELYAVFSLARAGFEAPEFYGKVKYKLTRQLKELATEGTTYDAVTKTNITEETFSSKKVPEQNYAFVVLAMTALGMDARTTGGYDLIEKMASKKLYEADNSYNAEQMMLFAFDSGDYALPEGENYCTREELVAKIAGNVDETIAGSIEWDLIDGAVMAVQPLAPYTESASVEKACQKVIRFAGKMQNTHGYYGDSDASNNAETAAQTLTMLGEFGIHPMIETENVDFVKNGHTLADAILEFVDLDQEKLSASVMNYSPEQILRGITSFVYAAENAGETVYRVKTVPEAKVPSEPFEEERPQPDPSATPSATPSVSPSAAPSTNPSATPSVSPSAAPSATPDANPSVIVLSETPAAKKNPAKKIVAAKKKINTKKGKTVKIVIKVAAKNPKKVTTDAVKVSGKKIKVKKITKKAGKITIKVKALKKGKRIVKIKVGKASTKVTLNVR